MTDLPGPELVESRVGADIESYHQNLDHISVSEQDVDRITESPINFSELGGAESRPSRS